jgi:hypothetical protein
MKDLQGAGTNLCRQFGPNLLESAKAGGHFADNLNKSSEDLGPFGFTSEMQMRVLWG